VIVTINVAASNLQVRLACGVGACEPRVAASCLVRAHRRSESALQVDIYRVRSKSVLPLLSRLGFGKQIIPKDASLPCMCPSAEVRLAFLAIVHKSGAGAVNAVCVISKTNSACSCWLNQQHNDRGNGTEMRDLCLQSLLAIDVMSCSRGSCAACVVFQHSLARLSACSRSGGRAAAATSCSDSIILGHQYDMMCCRHEREAILATASSSTAAISPSLPSAGSFQSTDSVPGL
jgi:hypothetical protein